MKENGPYIMRVRLIIAIHLALQLFICTVAVLAQG